MYLSAADSPITFGQALEEALEIESFFEAVEPVLGGCDVPAVGKRYVGRATLEVLTERPLHNHVHDDPVGNGVAPAALELGQQPLDHVVGDVVPSITGPDEAALDDDRVPRRDELGMVSGLEQQGIFGITSITHPIRSHRHLRPILRRIQERQSGGAVTRAGTACSAHAAAAPLPGTV